METASLRIKFTPLLSKSQKGSNCCLEIIPEVSCVQNLDKISWKQEKDLIEYTIPMTYKIILKKRESIKSKKYELAADAVELDKTYHSCVDLLPPSSMTTFDFASGDITRIISDTYMLGKISAKLYDDTSVTIDNTVNNIKTHEIKITECPNEQPEQKQEVQEQTVFVKNKNEDVVNDNATPRLLLSDSYIKRVIDNYSLDKITSSDNTLKECKSAEILSVTKIKSNDCPKEQPVVKKQLYNQSVFGYNQRDYIVNDYAIPRLLNLSDSYMNRIIDKYPLDKLTNTENTLTICKITETLSVETEEEVDTRNRDDSKRMLSLSPICSINTNDNTFLKSPEEIPLNIVVDRIFQHEIGDSNDNFKLPTRNEKHVNIKVIHNDGEASIENININYRRELPEVRIAKFIKKMENEIMPLKMMLNDIIQKCSTLGLYKNKCIARNLILYKTIPCIKRQREKLCKTERQAKSNRVVYSIVFDGVMDNGSVMEQLVRSLSFEVEAIPQDDIIKLKTTSKSAPLNVKIRVRKKEEAGFQHGVLTLPKHEKTDRIPERIRLVSSDQTIMSFNVVMEADFQKPIKKPRKNILGIFKPTTCLGAQPDEDDYAYLPNTTYKADFVDENTSKSEAALTQFTLKKNEDSANTSMSIPKKKNKDIFGECKPGGCLDPPFGEDRYTYSPANEQTTISGNNVIEPERTPEQVPENKTRTSSIFSNKLFNWKRKRSNDETLDKNVMKKEANPESVLELYQAGSLQPTKTHSHSIMTYPSTLTSSEPPIREEKPRGSRIYNEASKNSFDIHSGSYFMIPKKAKKLDDKNNTVKINNDVDLGDAKVDTGNIKPELNVILQRQDVKDYENKHVLRTKDSVTDVRGAKGYIIGSTDGKTNAVKPDSEEISIPVKENELSSNKKTTDNLIPIFIPLLTKTDPFDSRNILSKKNEDSLNILGNEGDVFPPSLNKKSNSDIPADIEILPLRAAQSIEENENDKNTIQNAETDALPSLSTKKIISDEPAEIEILPLRAAQSNEENEKDKNNILNAETDVLPSISTKMLVSDEPADIETSALRAAQNTDGNMNDKNKTVNHSLKDIGQSFIDINEKDDISSPEKENLFGLNQKPIEKLTPNNILKKPESKESKNFISHIGEGPKKTQNTETDNLPLAKRAISEIPTQIEITPVHMGYDNDTIIKNTNKIQNLNLIDTEQRPKDIEERNLKDPEQDNFTTKNSTEEALASQVNEFLNQNKWPEGPITIQSKNKSLTQTHSDYDIGMTKSTASFEDRNKSENDVKPNILFNSEKITSIKKIPEKERISKDYQELSLVNEPGFKKNSEIKNIPSIQDIDQNKPVSKSVLTIGANHEMSVYDIIATNSDNKITLQEKNSSISRDVRDYGSKIIATPVERDTPLEIIQIEGDELQHIWKNTAHPLQSDTKFRTENERLASYSKINTTVDEIGGNRIDIDMKKPMLYETNNSNDFKNQYLDKSNELVSTETNSDNQNEQTKKSVVKSIDSQSKVIDSKGILSQAKNKKENGQNYELDSVVSQTIEQVLFTRQASKSLTIIAESEKIYTPVRPLEEITEFTQTKAASPNIFIEPKARKTSNIVDDNVLSKLSILPDNETRYNYNYNDVNNDLNQNKFDTGQIPVHHYDMENYTLQETYENKYPSPTDINPIDRITSNADNVQHIIRLKLDNEPVADKDYDSTFMSPILKYSYSKPDFDLDSKANITSIYPHATLDPNEHQKQIYPRPKADGKTAYPKSDSMIYLKPGMVNTETIEITGIDKRLSDEHSLHQAQTPEATANASPYIINLAIQRYIDDNNQVHIKSFDPDIAPKDFPKNTVSVIKRYVELDDKIKIPIDSENDIYIQIKTKTQKVITKESGNDNKHIDDPIKRNVIIADDICRTLTAVYEDELLPLRNTISELKNNMEMLTSLQMVIRGRMFIKKTKPTRIVPLFRKCACMRR